MNWWDRHGNTVLTVIEFIGFVGTVTTTAMAAPKIKQKLDCRRRKKIVKQELAPGVSTEYVEDLEFKENAVEIARCVFPECLTPLIFGTVTVLAMIGCKKQYSSQAELAAAYTVGKRLYDEHKEKIHEVMDDIRPTNEDNMSSLCKIEESKLGDPKKRTEIFLLEYSCRRFLADPEEVEKGLIRARNLLLEDPIGILGNELYSELGLMDSKIGAFFGFLSTEMMDDKSLSENEKGPLYWEIHDIVDPVDESRCVHVISFDNAIDEVSWFREMGTTEYYFQPYQIQQELMNR